MKILIGLLGASLAGGICILIFYIISILCRNKYRIRIKKVIWLFIALRLLIPLNIMGIKTITVEIPNVVLGETPVSGSSERRENLVDSMTEGYKKIIDEEITLGSVALSVWIFGAAIFFLYYSISYIIMYRKIMLHSCECKDESIKKIAESVALEMKIKKIPKIRIVEAESKGPFTIIKKELTILNRYIKYGMT